MILSFLDDSPKKSLVSWTMVQDLGAHSESRAGSYSHAETVTQGR
jgi:hypothetical protein